MRDMPNVEFSEENQFNNQSESQAPREKSGLIGFLIRTGLAKDEKSANVVLFIVFLVIVAITLYVIFG